MPLTEFWPRRGPVWDALGFSSRGDLLFVEAKAHVSELASPPSKAGADALQHIERSLGTVREFLAGTTDANWAGTFYQYTNRLAHLYLLREVNQLSAHLVFVYFLNATDIGGPTTEAEWKAALTLLYAAVGLRKWHALSRYVHNVFVDATELAALPDKALQPAAPLDHERRG